ncbi:MAG TPA: patatin-like phospholipase family protein [Gemmatimonadota bacterium]|nr:patatin-like phospholipase family protein [Gemmatimonadota bacterium]
MTPPIDSIAAPRSIAGTFLGGFVPAVAYHFGVMEVLAERGFVLRAGFRANGEARETGPPGIDFVVGSSAGAFFVTAACAGMRPADMLGAVSDEATRRGRFEARLLGEGKGLSRKTLEWARVGPKPAWASRRTWKSWAAESTLNMLFPLWTLEPMADYLRHEVLQGRDWEDLRTEAAILAVDLNHPLTLVVGEREAPILELFRRQPVRPEAIHLILGSEGHKIVRVFEEAGVDPGHPALEPFRADPDARSDTLRIRGVPMALAAVGSMATYPFYQPVTLEDPAGRPYRIGHYTVQVQDGEDRNPFTTDVAEESGADLVIVSSISAPYKYLHGFGSLAERGYSAVYQQKTAQGRDAKQEDVKSAHRTQQALYRASRAILEAGGCGPDAVARLDAEFQRIARIAHVRIRIYPDPDIAAENRILRTLDPLEFTPRAVDRARQLGVMVARRVLARYRFEFLEGG